MGILYKFHVLGTRPEPFYEALGRRIAEVREQRGLTQAQLAEKLTPSVTRASVANVESGKQRVLAHTLVDVARILNVSIGDLLSGQEGSRKPQPSRSDVASALLKEKIPAGVARELANAFGHTAPLPRRKP